MLEIQFTHKLLHRTNNKPRKLVDKLLKWLDSTEPTFISSVVVQSHTKCYRFIEIFFNISIIIKICQSSIENRYRQNYRDIDIFPIYRTSLHGHYNEVVFFKTAAGLTGTTTFIPSMSIFLINQWFSGVLHFFQQVSNSLQHEMCVHQYTVASTEYLVKHWAAYALLRWYEPRAGRISTSHRRNYHVSSVSLGSHLI